MKTLVTLLAATAMASLTALPAQAQAQAVRTERNMSLELASQLAAATVAACSANNYNVAAVVVDRAGTTRALLRADNAGPHTLESARLKA